MLTLALPSKKKKKKRKKKKSVAEIHWSHFTIQVHFLTNHHSNET